MVANVILILLIVISAYSWWDHGIKESSKGKLWRKSYALLIVILLCICLLIYNNT